MSKLTALLQEQQDLAAESDLLTRFLHLAKGRGNVTILVEGEDDEVAMTFGPDDIVLELEILGRLDDYAYRVQGKLNKVNEKVSAMEALIG